MITRQITTEVSNGRGKSWFSFRETILQRYCSVQFRLHLQEAQEIHDAQASGQMMVRE